VVALLGRQGEGCRVLFNIRLDGTYLPSSGNSKQISSPDASPKTVPFEGVLENMMIQHNRRSLSLALFTSALIFALVFCARGNAQTADSARATKNTLVPGYDLSKEVKVQGAIEKIDGFGTSGPIGTHILIQTATGTVDAHLGFGSAASPKRLGISVGENVTVIGMMETVGSSSVLMARILTTPIRIFVLRNEQGIPIRGTIHRNVRAGTWYSMNLTGPDFDASFAPGTLRGGL
jgi:hypothetical protein